MSKQHSSWLVRRALRGRLESIHTANAKMHFSGEGSREAYHTFPAQGDA